MGLNDFPSTSGLPPLVAFGDFQLDRGRVEVTYKGRPLAMRPKAYALLSYLVAHAGRTLGKQELMTILWPNVVVTDDSLVQCVADLRAALGPDGANLVTTVPRHGYRFDGNSIATHPPTATAPPERRSWRMAIGATVLAALGMVVAWALGPRPAANADQAFSRERSLAVLPLVPQGSQSSKEFADAMTDELIGDIARLPGTTVIARASAATAVAQEQDLRGIGKLLDVAYVVTGTVAREDQAVEVALQFVSATTGVVLWSERWRQADAELATQRNDIPLRIARALDLQLTSAAYKAPISTARSPAIASLARGDHLLRSATGDPPAVLKARAAYQEAIAIDPASARGWTGLALSYLSEIQSRWSKDPDGQAELAAQAIQKALAIDPDYSVAHYAQGHLRIVRGDPAGALSSYERVLAVNPSDAWAHARVAAALLALGRFDEVAAPVERARRISPLEANQVAFGRVIAGAAHFHKGEDDAAYLEFQAAAASNPRNHSAWALMASLDALHGRSEAAAHAMAQLRALRPQATVSVFRNTNAGNGPALQAGNERYFAGLLKAGLPP